MPRPMWSVVIAREVRRELLAQPIDPLDLVTLPARLRELVRTLIRTRGQPPGVERAEAFVPGGFRFVSERLETIFAVTTRRKRRWWRPWRVEVEGRINVLALRLYPLRSGE